MPIANRKMSDQTKQHKPRAPSRSNGKSSRRHSANLDKKDSSCAKRDFREEEAAPPLQKPLRLRIALAGAEGVGKSCIIKRYCEKRFVPRHQPTVGIDYGATRILVDGREVSVHVFDTAGAHIFRDVRNEFYRDAHGVVLVFDVTDRASFDALSEWTKEIYTELARAGRDFSSTVLMVCANKCDLSPRQVDEIEARLWAELRGFQLFETSALTGEGVNVLFHAFFSAIVRARDDGADGLPSTPSTARKVRLSASSATLLKPSRSIGSLPEKASPANSRKSSSSSSAAASAPEPSPEQRTVMSRLAEGGGRADPWHQMGLKRGCSQDEVNKVFRRLAALLHPDKTAVKGADEAFKVLGVARRNILKSMGAIT